MKKFDVTIHYEGNLNYTITAKDEDEAYEKARERFNLADVEQINDNLDDNIDIDVYEI